MWLSTDHPWAKTWGLGNFFESHKPSLKYTNTFFRRAFGVFCFFYFFFYTWAFFFFTLYPFRSHFTLSCFLQHIQSENLEQIIHFFSDLQRDYICSALENVLWFFSWGLMLSKHMAKLIILNPSQHTLMSRHFIANKLLNKIHQNSWRKNIQFS